MGIVSVERYELCAVVVVHSVQASKLSNCLSYRSQKEIIFGWCYCRVTTCLCVHVKHERCHQVNRTAADTFLSYAIRNCSEVENTLVCVCRFVEL